MKKLLFYSIITLLTLYSCDDNNHTIVDTKWQSADNTMTFKFETDSTCLMKYYADPDNLNNYESANYVYSYESPSILLLVAPASGFSSYEGTINGNIMKLKIYNSSFDYIDFYKTK